MEQLLIAQPDLPCGGILRHMRTGCRLRDGDDVAVADAPGQQNLQRGNPVLQRDVLNRPVLGKPFTQAAGLGERGIGHDGDFVASAPGQQLMLNTS
ncbi:hypothetical protein D3C73_1175620 [compost metagenome]